MNANRHIERHQLPYYLNVFNAFTDKPIGHLGNVSLDGLMLISQLPVLVGGCFDMRLKIPGPDALRHIDFSATCLWCREDVTPGSLTLGLSSLHRQWSTSRWSRRCATTSASTRSLRRFDQYLSALPAPLCAVGSASAGMMLIRSRL